MDDLDRQIIARLRQDSRIPAATLAADLKVSRGTVQNRIERMLARGAILGFTIRTRGVEAQQVRAVMCVEVTGDRTQAVVRALRGFPQVAAIHSTNGRWDLVVDLATDSLAGFSETLDAIRRIDGIGVTETSLLLKSY